MATKNGTVKWFNTKKKYGFITDDEGNDVFVHISGIVKGRKNNSLKPEDQVTFEIVEGKTGPQAGNVELVRK